MDGQARLLTIEEAADHLRLSPTTLRHWICQRRLPSVRLGGRRLLLQADINALVDQNRISADARVALVRLPEPGMHPARAGSRSFRTPKEDK